VHKLPPVCQSEYSTRTLLTSACPSVSCDLCLSSRLLCLRLLVFLLPSVSFLSSLLPLSMSSWQEEEDLYLKIYEYSEAVIHLESSHTRIPAQTTSDREMTQLLHRYGCTCVGRYTYMYMYLSCQRERSTCGVHFPLCVLSSPLTRCADVTVKLQLCMEQLSQVSDILPLIEVRRFTHTYIHTYRCTL